MGATFYYYPDPNGALAKIDLGLPVTSIVDWPVVDMRAASSFSGDVSRTIYSTQRRVTIRIELFKDYTVISQLETLDAHLRAGGLISFAEEEAGVFAGFARVPLRAGATSTVIKKNMFEDYDTHALASGDIMVMQGPSPLARRESAVITGVSGNSAVFTAGIVNDFSDEDFVLVRDRRFWPFLQLAPGATSNVAISPNQGRVTQNITFELFEPPGAIARVAPRSSIVWRGGDTKSTPKPSDLSFERSKSAGDFFDKPLHSLVR